MGLGVGGSCGVGEVLRSRNRLQERRRHGSARAGRWWWRGLCVWYGAMMYVGHRLQAKHHPGEGDTDQPYINTYSRAQHTPACCGWCVPCTCSAACSRRRACGTQRERGGGLRWHTSSMGGSSMFKTGASSPHARVVASDEQLVGLGGQEAEAGDLLASSVLPPLVLHICKAGGGG